MNNKASNDTSYENIDFQKTENVDRVFEIDSGLKAEIDQ